jgi:hypothetical protein
MDVEKHDLCERLFEFTVRIIKRTVPEADSVELNWLIFESAELKNILGSIIRKST